MRRSTKVQKTCKECGKIFLAYSYEIKRGGAQYCSPKCWYTHAKKFKLITRPDTKVEKVCIVCGKKYKILNCHNKRGNAKFCSITCKSKFIIGKNNPNFRNAIKTAKCRMCGKTFTTGRHRIKQGRGITCSVSCRVEYYLKFQKKNKETYIERSMEQELIRRVIPYMKQVPIKEYLTIVDFLLPNKVIIYCDGDYWHNLPEVAKRGKRQNIELSKHGYKVFRFWEHEINKNVSECVDKIIAFLETTFLVS